MSQTPATTASTPTGPGTPSGAPLRAVTGVQLMQGIGHAPAKGFWADAWSHVLKRPGAVAGLCWVGVLAFFAIFAPLLASGHPLILRELGAAGEVTRTWSPLVRFLTPLDVVLIAAGTMTLVSLVLPIGRRAARVKWALGISAGALLVVIASSMARGVMRLRTAPEWLSTLEDAAIGPLAAATIGVGLLGAIAAIARPGRSAAGRWLGVGLGALLGVLCVWGAWDRPALERFDYQRREAAGQVSATYTLIPFSPQQRFSELSRIPPGTTLGERLNMTPEQPGAGRTFMLGTDAFGADVLTQLMHASRLSISIGLVSTGIALTIGITLGALMGYFGGKVDLVLYRVVEIFMAVPVLFLLIVAAAVLPPELRTTYVMMAIIGCFTWTGIARFTRAEFLKLRNQDFVQSARAVGLPLRAVLFKHMLPNGVAPVLVDASFAIASAITVEAVLSYLNLGPIDQPSWGRLLASAVSAEGEFKSWLAIYPGLAIFLSVLSYNLIGEALRDAIDPKLKKARV